jgi:hypothetical protein
MNFLIPSAKKTNPGSSRTTSVAAGALVFTRLKRDCPCLGILASIYLSLHVLSQKNSTEYRADHYQNPGSDLPDLQTGKQNEGERQALS